MLFRKMRDNDQVIQSILYPDKLYNQIISKIQDLYNGLSKYLIVELFSSRKMIIFPQFYYYKMDCLNVSFLNLHKQIKGVLVHNGILKVQDLMKNFKELDKLKTEPQLQSDQIEALRQELARIKVLSDMLDRENPLEFSLSLQTSVVHGSDHFMNAKRKKIVLMKELQFQQVQQQLINGPNNILQYPPLPLGGIEDLQEDSFLDDVFGIGETTELCGLSQTAKTQIAFQLCMNVQIPKELGGVDGEALYIDTHGDFAVERITEMAKSLRQSVLKKIEKEQQQMPHLVKRYKEEFALDKILAKVRYVRILDEGQQQCLHNQFEDRLQQFPRIRLIIFDTFSEHFRLPELGYGERKRIISQALMGLLEMAQKYQLCIILINNMKLSKKDFLSEVGAGGQPGVPGQPMWSQSKPEPMFGEDLFQCVTNRVFLEKDHNLSEENIIKARLIKGSIASMQTANPTTHFQILEKGIVPII